MFSARLQRKRPWEHLKDVDGWGECHTRRRRHSSMDQLVFSEIPFEYDELRTGLPQFVGKWSMVVVGGEMRSMAPQDAQVDASHYA